MKIDLILQVWRSNLSCGDIIYKHSFECEKNAGNWLIFGDMTIYSMGKNNTFNGMPLPKIIALKEDGSWEIVKHFAYGDFKSRV